MGGPGLVDPTGGQGKITKSGLAVDSFQALYMFLHQHIESKKDAKKNYNDWRAENPKTTFKQKLFALTFIFSKKDHIAPKEEDMDKFNDWIKENKNATAEEMAFASTLIKLYKRAPTKKDMEAFKTWYNDVGAKKFPTKKFLAQMLDFVKSLPEKR